MTPERLREIETLFHEARERMPAERDAFLAGACANDPTLRREVESLLAQPPVGVIDGPVAALAADLMTPPAPRLAPGSSIGPYRIARLVDVGGMGEVYRARDTILGRDVAIKMLPQHFTADPDRLARFEREARVLATLSHPNIAAIYSVEQRGDIHALVLELVEGQTLAERIARAGRRVRRGGPADGPITLHDAVSIARQIAEALDVAHEKGIVHRDLKPANVMITADGVVTWFNRSGKTLAQVGGADGARKASVSLSLSPDGHQVALSLTMDGNRDLWLLDLERGGVMSRLTSDPANDSYVLWSRDGMRLAFGSNRNGPLHIFQRSVAGSTDEALLVTPQNTVPADWSPDGHVLLYLTADPKTHLDIWALPIGGDEKPFPVIQSPVEDLNPQFSPDGAWMAYQSDESNRHEVYVRPFRRPGAPMPISTDGGMQPRWRRDGRELFYLGLDRWLMAVPIAFSSSGRSVEAGIPMRLFQTKIGAFPLYQREYEVSPDGQRFLMDAPEEEVLAPIVVIQNWRP